MVYLSDLPATLKNKPSDLAYLGIDIPIGLLEGSRACLGQQAWGISRKIKQVDDAIAPDCQRWAFEVHPEVCFWALAGHRSMVHNKKTEAGVNERLDLLRAVFPDIQRHLANRPSGVGKDDLIDAAVAAWTALRLARGAASHVCTPERDDKGLAVSMWY